MNRLIRTLSLGTAFVLGTAAFAQPLPPFDLTISGLISGCNPTGTNFVNIQTQQGTQPAVDIDVPVDGNCGFSVDLTLDAYQGWFLISTPCNGAIVSETVSYTVNVLNPDSNYVFVVLNCGANVPDCEGVLGGTAIPGTGCTVPGTTLAGTWSANCECVADSVVYDCMQVPNGPDMPGTPCTNPATGVNGTWSALCECQPTVNPTCQADFYILQAYENGDTTGAGVPVPNTLWVWNLSSGGSGVYQFLWSFGDGTSSTEAFPSHTYAGSGPYTLCLTISDSEGCTSTHCDTLSVDDDGIYNGLIGSGGNRSALTVNVVNPLAMSIEESSFSTISLWPNPAREQLNIALDSRLDGAVNMEVIDLNGRVMMIQQERSVAGNNRFVLSTEGLPAGLYALRISNGSNTITQRFVRD